MDQLTTTAPVRRIRRRTIAERLTDGELHGFTAGPRPGAHPENVAIDRRVAWESDCSFCGQHGQEYRAFHTASEYRCYTLCPACGHSEAF